MRKTRQRELILTTLRNMHTHPTADMLYDKVRKEMPSISLGTIYRNLDILAEKGVISVLEISGSARRFDAQVAEHSHVRCIKCASIEDLNLDLPDSVKKEAVENTAYALSGASMLFTGICPDCAKDVHDEQV